MKFQIKSNSLNFQLKNSVIKQYPELEDIVINPSKGEQNFKSENYYGYGKVTLNSVTNEIDENIKAENIKKDVNILGVIGNVEEVNTTEISINPTETEQIITPEEPYNGFSKVTVGAQNGVNLDDYLVTTITSSNRAYLGTGKIFKKLPVLKVETNSLQYAFGNYEGNVIPILEGEEKVTNWSYFLANATSIMEIPQYNTSNGTNFNYAFSATNVKKVALLDFGKATTITRVLSPSNTNLTDLGGFIDLGKNFDAGNPENHSNYTLNLYGCSNITYESALNVLNNLYDIASIGIQRQKVRFHSNVMTKLQATEEGQQAITNAIAKGWNVTTS